MAVLRSCALVSSVLIIIAGVAGKLPGLFQNPHAAGGVDPILFLSEARRDELAVALELTILVCLWLLRSKPVQQAWWVATLGGMFALYHAALAIANIHGPCPCLGTAGQVFGLS